MQQVQQVQTVVVMAQPVPVATSQDNSTATRKQEQERRGETNFLVVFSAPWLKHAVYIK